jgi:hypothetical protein
MVPPHEACSARALKAMSRLGFDAACVGRARPWCPQPDGSPEDPGLLARWHPSDMVDGTMPVLPRYLIGRPWQELALRALLGQPLIVFAHQWDFADGLDALAETAGRINSFALTNWASLAHTAEGCSSASHERGALVVSMHGRRASVEVPRDVGRLEVLVPQGVGERPLAVRDGSGRAHPFECEAGWSRATFQARAGRHLLEILPARSLDPQSVPGRRPDVWPLGRRALVQARERSLPLRRRYGFGARSPS